MSKSLIIIRHAKSDWSNDLPDFERPLNSRGYKDAAMMGQYLVQQQIEFCGIYCSPANRAQLTLAELNNSLQISENKIFFDEDLYLASRADLCSYIEALPNDQNKIGLIGHNPGLTELCNYLTDDDLENLPTCGIYEIALHIDNWQACGQGLGERKHYCVPRMLKER